MYDLQKLLSLAAGEIVIFLSERAAETTWPEASAATLWKLAAVSAVLWIALIYSRDFGDLFHWDQTMVGQVPLIEGIDLAWAGLRDTPMLSTVQGEKIFRHLTYEMFNGTRKAVPLYGIRPPLRSRSLIGNAHEYRINEDGCAIHRFDENDRVTDLHVRRADVKRWVRDIHADMRKEMRQSKSGQ